MTSDTRSQEPWYLVITGARLPLNHPRYKFELQEVFHMPMPEETDIEQRTNTFWIRYKSREACEKAWDYGKTNRMMKGYVCTKYNYIYMNLTEKSAKAFLTGEGVI